MTNWIGDKKKILKKKKKKPFICAKKEYQSLAKFPSLAKICVLSYIAHVALSKACMHPHNLPSQIQIKRKKEKKKKKSRGQRTCIAERLQNEFIELAVRCVRLVKLDGMERWMAKLAGCRGVMWGGGAHLSSKTHKLIPNQVVFTTLQRNPHCDAFVDRCHQEVQNCLKKNVLTNRFNMFHHLTSRYYYLFF